MTEELLNFLKDKNTTLSFRVSLSDVEKLLKGDNLTIKIKGKKFNIKRIE